MISEIDWCFLITRPDACTTIPATIQVLCNDIRHCFMTRVEKLQYCETSSNVQTYVVAKSSFSVYTELNYCKYQTAASNFGQMIFPLFYICLSLTTSTTLQKFRTVTQAVVVPNTHNCNKKKRFSVILSSCR